MWHLLSKLRQEHVVLEADGHLALGRSFTGIDDKILHRRNPHSRSDPQGFILVVMFLGLNHELMKTRNAYIGLHTDFPLVHNLLSQTARHLLSARSFRRITLFFDRFR
jgi:hypothetical protein